MPDATKPASSSDLPPFQQDVDMEKMSTAEFLSFLAIKGIGFNVYAGKLQLDAPAGVLTVDLQNQVRSRKVDIISHLSKNSLLSEMTTAPVSFAQQRLWLLDSVSPEIAAYNIPQSWPVNAAIDMNLMRLSLEKLVDRHDSLRTCFAYRNGVLLQTVMRKVAVPLKFTDLSAIESDALRNEELNRIQVEEGGKGFELSQAPLVRFHIFKLFEDRYVFFYSIHHIIADQQSLNILKRDISELYRSAHLGTVSSLPTLTLDYARVAIAQRSEATIKLHAVQLSYWRDRLNGMSTLLELPFSKARPPLISYQGSRQRLTIGSTATYKLRQLASTSNTSLYMLMLTMFCILIYRYTGLRDLCIGTPISGRKRREEEDIVGMFVNMVPLRCLVDPQSNVIHLVRSISNAVLSDFENSDVPFQQLVSELHPERSQSFSPFFQIMFALNPKGSGYEDLEQEVDLRTSKYDLALQISERPESLELFFEYRSELFDDGDIYEFGLYFSQLASSVADHQEQDVVSINLLNSQAIEALDSWNQTYSEIDANESIVSLFKAQSVQKANNLALVSTFGSYTFRELDHLSDLLSNSFRRKGVQAGDIIGVGLRRSPDLIIALLSVLKSGAAYLPLDPKYPDERLAYMLSDSDTKILITARNDLSDGVISHLKGLDVVFIDEHLTELAVESVHAEHGGSTLPASSDAAYVIYTSGSTGKPKGTIIEHRNAVALLSWAKKFFDADSLRAVLASTSVCFDLSIFEIFLPLVTGNTIVLVDNILELSNSSFAEQITLINTVPSAMRSLLEVGIPSSVLTVCMAGEFLPTDLVNRVYDAGVRKVIDLYGPTETTTYSTVAIRAVDAPATIGRPIANTRVYLLDENLQLVPRGAVGEIFIGGSGVARGYLNRPELTVERFVSISAIDSGRRLYRTGDLATRLADGALVYRGRRDSQVKLRGHRIELGEVESALREIVGLSAVAVFVKKRDSGDVLCAVVELNKASSSATWITDSDLESSIGPGEISAALRRRLPAYMIPSQIVVTTAMPMTLNGKVDRKALDALFDLADVKPEDYPQDILEQWIANIFASRLRRPSISSSDDFFDDLGGHSLVAFEMFAEIEKRIGVAMGLATLFQAPTVRLLSPFVRRQAWRSLNCLTLLSPGSSEDVLYMLGSQSVGSLFDSVRQKDQRVMLASIVSSQSADLAAKEIDLFEAGRPSIRIVSTGLDGDYAHYLQRSLKALGFSKVTVDSLK